DWSSDVCSSDLRCDDALVDHNCLVLGKMISVKKSADVRERHGTGGRLEQRLHESGAAGCQSFVLGLVKFLEVSLVAGGKPGEGAVHDAEELAIRGRRYRRR